MKTTRLMAVAVLIVGSGVALDVGTAQQPGIERTDLQRHDLGVPGREVVQVRVDFDPGAAFGRHTHPGEEIVCPRRLAGVSGGGQAAGDARGHCRRSSRRGSSRPG